MSEAQRNGLGRDFLPLRGRVALVTGVSRRGGIGCAIACRLAAYGASVFAHHFADRDREQEWGADDLDTVLVKPGLDANEQDENHCVPDQGECAEHCGQDALISNA